MSDEMDLAEVETYWRDVSERQVGSSRYWGLPALLAEYDRRGEALAVLVDVAEALAGGRPCRNADEAIQRARALAAAAGPSALLPAYESTSTCLVSPDGKHRWGTGRWCECGEPRWWRGVVTPDPSTPAASEPQVRNRLCEHCGRWHDRTGQQVIGWESVEGTKRRNLPEGHMPPDYRIDAATGWEPIYGHCEHTAGGDARERPPARRRIADSNPKRKERS